MQRQFWKWVMKIWVDFVGRKEEEKNGAAGLREE